MRKKLYTQLTLNECYDTLDCMRETVATDWYHTKVDWTKSVDFPMENEIEVDE